VVGLIPSLSSFMVFLLSFVLELTAIIYMHIWGQSETNIVERQDQLKEKPKILPLPNGPYYLLNDMEPSVVENLKNSGESLSSIRGVALYRLVLPTINSFCDGTHTIIGFSSKNKETLDGNSIIKDKRKNYVGKEIIKIYI
jgi:CDGSH-type Zn-finger protein